MVGAPSKMTAARVNNTSLMIREILPADSRVSTVGMSYNVRGFAKGPVLEIKRDA